MHRAIGQSVRRVVRHAVGARGVAAPPADGCVRIPGALLADQRLEVPTTVSPGSFVSPAVAPAVSPGWLAGLPGMIGPLVKAGILGAGLAAAPYGGASLAPSLPPVASYRPITGGGPLLPRPPVHDVGTGSGSGGVAVPEPPTALLLPGFGVAAMLALWARRKWRAAG